MAGWQAWAWWQRNIKIKEGRKRERRYNCPKIVIGKKNLNEKIMFLIFRYQVKLRYLFRVIRITVSPWLRFANSTFFLLNERDSFVGNRNFALLCNGMEQDQEERVRMRFSSVIGRARVAAASRMVLSSEKLLYIPTSISLPSLSPNFPYSAMTKSYICVGEYITSSSPPIPPCLTHPPLCFALLSFSNVQY